MQFTRSAAQTELETQRYNVHTQILASKDKHTNANTSDVVCVCVHLYWFMNSPTSSCEYQASALTEPQNPRGCVQLCQFNACRTRPENTHTYTQTYNTYLPLHRLMMSATGSVCHSRRQSVTTSTTAIKSTATITRAELLFTAR